MKVTPIKKQIKLTRLDILHHGLLIILFPIFSFITTGMIWNSVELLFGFESRIMGSIFYFLNLGIIVLVTSKLFVPMKLKFKYIGILLVLFMFSMPFAIKYVIK